MAFVGTELKFQLVIESDGFSMADDDFKVIISNYNKRKEIKKEDMATNVTSDNFEYFLAEGLQKWGV